MIGFQSQISITDKYGNKANLYRFEQENVFSFTPCSGQIFAIRNAKFEYDSNGIIVYTITSNPFLRIDTAGIYRIKK